MGNFPCKKITKTFSPLLVVVFSAIGANFVGHLLLPSEPLHQETWDQLYTVYRKHTVWKHTQKYTCLYVCIHQDCAVYTENSRHMFGYIFFSDICCSNSVYCLRLLMEITFCQSYWWQNELWITMLCICCIQQNIHTVQTCSRSIQVMQIFLCHQFSCILYTG